MDSNHRSEDATDLQGKVIIFHGVLFTGVGDSDKIKMSEYVKRGHCIAAVSYTHLDVYKRQEWRRPVIRRPRSAAR